MCCCGVSSHSEYLQHLDYLEDCQCWAVSVTGMRKPLASLRAGGGCCAISSCQLQSVIAVLVCVVMGAQAGHAASVAICLVPVQHMLEGISTAAMPPWLRARGCTTMPPAGAAVAGTAAAGCHRHLAVQCWLCSSNSSSSCWLRVTPSLDCGGALCLHCCRVLL